MDRLTAEEALAHPYMADYSFPLDEPVSLHPFHIEDEVDDILLMDQSHSHTCDRCAFSLISLSHILLGLTSAEFVLLYLLQVSSSYCSTRVYLQTYSLFMTAANEVFLFLTPLGIMRASSQKLTGTCTAPMTQMKFRLTQGHSPM